MKATPIKEHIKVTRSIKSLANYCRVTEQTAYNRFLNDYINDRYAKYVLEWIEINNDKGMDICDYLQSKIKK